MESPLRPNTGILRYRHLRGVDQRASLPERESRLQQFLQQVRHLFVTASRWGPIYLHDLNVLLFQTLRKVSQPHRDNNEGRLQKHFQLAAHSILHYRHFSSSLQKAAALALL
jgi:hypothetical protein